MTASFEVAEDATLLRLRRPDFMTIMLRYPELADKLDAAGHELFQTLSPTSRKRDNVSWSRMSSLGLFVGSGAEVDHAGVACLSVRRASGVAG